MNAATAETMLWVLQNAVTDRHYEGAKQSFTIEHFLDSLASAAPLREQEVQRQIEDAARSRGGCSTNPGFNQSGSHGIERVELKNSRQFLIGGAVLGMVPIYAN